MYRTIFVYAPEFGDISTFHLEEGDAQIFAAERPTAIYFFAEIHPV